MSEDIRITTWTTFLEEYFASTGEKAHCLSWIHKQSEQLYSKRTTFIDLPVIVLSGVLGFLSVGSSSMFRGDEMIASISVGIGSLFVSVLNTVGSYFQWAKRAEGHRIASIQYAKLYRFLLIEMSLPRDERMNPNDLLKLTKESYDRLQEISPLVPPEIVAQFKTKFGDPKYDTISKPEETNGLEKITIFSDVHVQSPPAIAYENPMLQLPQTRSQSRTRTSPTKQRVVGISPALDSPPIGSPIPVPTHPQTDPVSSLPHLSLSEVSPSLVAHPS